jgi:single-strand DNA-binding protein
MPPERKKEFMNKVMLIGRMTRDPELKTVGSNNTATTRITLAIDRPGKDAGTDFINVQVWGTQAENVCKYLSKGRQVAVEGRIQTGQYTDKEGKTVYTTDIVANSVEFLGSGGTGKNGGGSAGSTGDVAPTSAPVEFEDAEDDIPF